MKKRVLLVVAICLALLPIGHAKAFVKYQDPQPKNALKINLSGFSNYAPFGYFTDESSEDYGHFESLFLPMMKKLAEDNNWNLQYKFYKSYPSTVRNVRNGEVDVLLGAYHQTRIYKGLELIFPAAIVNPVTIFMLPDRINEVKSAKDIYKLKGVRISTEIYNDYIEDQLKNFNIITVETPYQLFEHLFTKKADYILVSHYYGLIQAIKFGLRSQIAVAKQTIWQMPMFIAISKLSPQRKHLGQKITRYLEVPENRKQFENDLTKLIMELERQSLGVVPPSFGLTKSDK